MIYLLLFLTHSLNHQNLTFADSRLGKKVYETNCATCHGLKGDGKGPAAIAMPKTPPRNFTLGKFKFGSSPKELFTTISKGIPDTPMPAWTTLSRTEKKAVIKYILKFKKKKKPSHK